MISFTNITYTCTSLYSSRIAHVAVASKACISHSLPNQAAALSLQWLDIKVPLNQVHISW